jgi:hypothetical protein
MGHRLLGSRLSAPWRPVRATPPIGLSECWLVPEEGIEPTRTFGPRDFEGQTRMEDLTENRGDSAVLAKATWLALARIGWFWIDAGTILGTVAGCQPAP